MGERKVLENAIISKDESVQLAQLLGFIESWPEWKRNAITYPVTLKRAASVKVDFSDDSSKE
jgi:hypothetical protein